jgi:hypothetical protein
VGVFFCWRDWVFSLSGAVKNVARHRHRRQTAASSRGFADHCGIQFIGMGLLGEMIVRVYHESQKEAYLNPEEDPWPGR